MRLVIATPMSLVLQRDGVVAVRAEDESGSFGIWPGHADFLTVLSISILRWRETKGNEHYCALRRGVFTVTGGQTITIATREAIVSEDFNQLEDVVLRRFREALEAEQSARVETTRLQTLAIRRIIQYLHPGRNPRLGPPP